MANLVCIGKSLTTELYNALQNIYKQLVDEKFKIPPKSFAFSCLALFAIILFPFTHSAGQIKIPPIQCQRGNSFRWWWWSFWPSMFFVLKWKSVFSVSYTDQCLCQGFRRKCHRINFTKPRTQHSRKLRTLPIFRTFITLILIDEVWFINFSNYSNEPCSFTSRKNKVWIGLELKKAASVEQSWQLAGVNFIRSY